MDQIRSDCAGPARFPTLLIIQSIGSSWDGMGWVVPNSSSSNPNFFCSCDTGREASSFFGAATMETMLKCAADKLRCRLISSRWFSHHVAISAPLGNMMNCTIEPHFVPPESNNESQKNPNIELPNRYFSGSMELMAVPKKKGRFRVFILAPYLLFTYSWVLRVFLYLLMVGSSIWIFRMLSIDFYSFGYYYTVRR